MSQFFTSSDQNIGVSALASVLPVTIFLGSKIMQMVIAAMKLKDAYSLEESYDQPRQHIKKQRHYFASKRPSSQSYGFSISHVWM